MATPIFLDGKPLFYPEELKELLMSYPLQFRVPMTFDKTVEICRKELEIDVQQLSAPESLE